MKKTLLCTLFCLLSIHASICIEDIRFENITTKNGLSQNTIYCMIQDHRGFIWIGTMNGLNRYDGNEFITLQPHFGAAPSLSDNRIKSLREDKNGYIWIRTFANYINCYDTKKEQFVEINPVSKTPKKYTNLFISSKNEVWWYGKEDGCIRVIEINGGLQTTIYDKTRLGTNRITFISESTDGTIWIGTDKGLKCLSAEQQIVHIPQTEPFNFHSMIELNQKRFFFTNNNRIFVSDIHTKKFGSLQLKIQEQNANLSINKVANLDGNQVFIATRKKPYLLNTNTLQITECTHLFGNKEQKNIYLHIDNKQNVWAYNRTGTLWQYVKREQRFNELNLIPSSILSVIDYERFNVLADKDNTIWITTYGNGLFSLNQETQEVTHFRHTKHINNGLDSNYLLSLFEDQSGEIWVGSEYAGISKISKKDHQSKTFFPDSKNSTDEGNSIRMLYEAKNGEIWIGTKNGTIQLFDPNFNKLSQVDIEKGIPYSIAEDNFGNKWVGTKGKGLLIFSANDKRNYQSYTMENTPSLTGNNIYSILKDSKGRMWLGSYGGGLLLAEQKNEKLSFRQFLKTTGNQQIVRSLIQDKEGSIWIGHDDGVAVFNPDELLQNRSHIKQFSFNKKDYKSLNNNEIKTIFEDSKGRIWLGTSGGGLNQVMKQKPIEKSWFKHYTTEMGLANDIVQSIAEDKEGFLWIGTENGISKFNPQTELFENFSFSTIWQGDFFSEATSCKRANGELMFGSYHGLYVFKPQDFVKRENNPKTTITALKINEKTISPADKNSPITESITTTKEITLTHAQNSFSIEFALLDFHNSQSHRYAFFLDGYEKTWNPGSKFNAATYRNVPPGQYIFRVKGCTTSGIWSNEETTIEITITPPWWKTIAAKLGYLFILIALVLFFTRLAIKMNKLHTKVEIEKQMTAYKLRFFTNISHEFRTPLTIIQGSIEKLTSFQELPEKIGKQVHILQKSSLRLLRLIDQLLEFRRLQNNKMELNLENTEVVSFFRDIFITFSEAAAKKQIDFKFETNETSWNMPLDRSKLDKIVYNLLSNAFKFTPDNGKITFQLTIQQAAQNLLISVLDNGAGVPKEKQSELFIRFKQINYSSGGTGIGLHLTAELATVHKGSVKYEDAKLGGSCFKVTIPFDPEQYDREDFLLDQDEEDQSIQRSLSQQYEHHADNLKESQTQKQLKNYNILIIEDDNEVRDFLVDQMSEYFSVTSAENGAIGYQQAINEYPDLIICDLMMPEMNGFELTQKLKSDLQTSHIPIIILTAHSSMEHQLEAIEAGADAYITKPFSVKFLTTRAIKLIEQREKLQQKFTKEPGLLPSTIYTSERDKEFTAKIHQLIEENMNNENFSVDVFAQLAGLGRTSFSKKIKGITGYSPNEYIRIIRMKKAAELLTTTQLNVSEVALKVGINDPFYFSRCFKAQFGVSPKQFLKDDQKHI